MAAAGLGLEPPVGVAALEKHAWLPSPPRASGLMRLYTHLESLSTTLPVMGIVVKARV
jgi:hypothetical protein